MAINVDLLRKGIFKRKWSLQSGRCHRTLWRNGVVRSAARSNVFEQDLSDCLLQNRRCHRRSFCNRVSSRLVLYTLYITYVYMSTTYITKLLDTGRSSCHFTWAECEISSYGGFRDRLCGLVVRVSGYRYRGSGFDPRRYQIFWVVVGLERGPLSLVRSIEELLEWKK